MRRVHVLLVAVGVLLAGAVSARAQEGDTVASAGAQGGETVIESGTGKVTIPESAMPLVTDMAAACKRDIAGFEAAAKAFEPYGKVVNLPEIAMKVMAGAYKDTTAIPVIQQQIAEQGRQGFQGVVMKNGKKADPAVRAQGALISAKAAAIMCVSERRIKQLKRGNVPLS